MRRSGKRRYLVFYEYILAAHIQKKLRSNSVMGTCALGCYCATGDATEIVMRIIGGNAKTFMPLRFGVGTVANLYASEETGRNPELVVRTQQIQTEC